MNRGFNERLNMELDYLKSGNYSETLPDGTPVRELHCTATAIDLLHVPTTALRIVVDQRGKLYSQGIEFGADYKIRPIDSFKPESREEMRRAFPIV